MFSSILSRFRPHEETTPDKLRKAYGEVNFSHLKPGSVNVTELGIYDPDLLRIMLKKFVENQPGIIESVRIATYTGNDATYLMVQDELTDEPGRWFALAPLGK